MPRRQIQFVRGCYYHIYNRGADRRTIFRNEGNYLYLLRLLKRVAAECEIAIIAYCLLPNHYHWLIRQDGDVPANLFPMRVFGSYVQAFNRQHNRDGTLFAGRFKAILVQEDGYLRHLCRYIHANAVHHGLATTPEMWPYSNYHEWLGLRNGTLVDREFVTAHFPDLPQYRQSVMDWLAHKAVMPAGLADYLSVLEKDE